MSSLARNVLLTSALVAATGAAFAARQSAPVFAANPLRISMLADASSNQAFMGTVQFKITNHSGDVVKVPSWQLPSAEATGKLFDVTRGGKPVEYLGPMIKRPAPNEADMVVFQPYETKLVTVDLSKAYDLSQGGDYSVRFRSTLNGASAGNGRSIRNGNGGLSNLETVPLKLWVDASNPLRGLQGQPGENQAKPGSTQVVNGVSYVGCSSTQISGAGNAVVSARTYSENAKGYLNGNNQGPRYTTWFGAYTSSRYSTVQQHFVAIDSAMDQSGGQIKINCGCNQNYYAYVYPTKPYEIFVCKAFWSAPNTGTDSRAGTLIHEMSHFNVVAATDDHVYGQSGAKSLAISDPAKAIDNADNHEYFAENTPYQN
jgi:peptidyl-Lys metalloendopeptidase